jgi:anthranilate phosphoribosyltransferase
LSEEFREILKARARGPEHLGPLDPELCERAMELILRGEATPAQIGGFLLVGRAVGDGPAELAAYTRAMRSFVREIWVPPGPPVVTVAGSFDGKTRTLNVGAAASLVAAAVGARVLMIGCENTPPKLGRTVFDALRGLGIPAPHGLDEAGASLVEHGFAAAGTEHFLPELHALLDLRWEMARRTVLNVLEKLLSPVPGSHFVVGITHRPFLKSVPEALVELGVRRALVVQAIEGSDEAPLDGNSSLVRVRPGGFEELHVRPESLGLPRTTRAHIPWKGAQDESRSVLEALGGEWGPVRNLLLYNAALRLSVADESAPLEEHVQRARSALDSGEALDLLGRLRRPAAVCS